LHGHRGPERAEDKSEPKAEADTNTAVQKAAWEAEERRGSTMRTLLTLIFLALAVSPTSATQADDEIAIREIQARWDDAWIGMM
jgi:hypothetical protein